MVSQNWWANSLFKGRIGEAVVEAVLSEFGYQVVRTGQEYLRSGEAHDGRGVFAPDLTVTNPLTGLTKHVEVKARFARPMSVIMEQARLEAIRRDYPGTILVFVSGYDGSINCSDADKMSAALRKARPDGFVEFDLLRNGWQPIWQFFPLVKPGERLNRLWEQLILTLQTFGERSVRMTKEVEMFEDERASLIDYVDSQWNPQMKQYIEGETIPEGLNLPQLWNLARQINAFLFALDVHGENNIDTREFHFTIDKVLGAMGEKYLTLDFEELGKALRPHPEALRRYEELLSVEPEEWLSDATAPPQGMKQSRRFLEKLQRILPPGVGKAYLEGPETPFEFEIDLRTAIAMASKRNHLRTES